MSKHYRISADIGGTFTDIVFQDSATGECGAAKVLSTPENPALSVLEGIRQVIPADATIDFFVHGTTVGLNALLTRRGAMVGLLTTHNFRDIYTIQGNDRGALFRSAGTSPSRWFPATHLHSAGADRSQRRGDRTAEHRRSGQLCGGAKREKFEAIAIAFLFSFKNPVHELAAAAYISRRLPGIDIALSHRVSPEWREFERTSTTVMDSYLAPVVRKYLATLVSELKGRLPAGEGLHIMESNGGVMSTASARENPLQTLLSGPVGGAIGGKALAAAAGRPNLICVDMGERRLTPA